MDKALEKVGIHPGDVIHLKDGTAVWWNGPDAKRKRVDSNNEEAGEPSAKCDSIAYVRQFDEGGGSHFSGLLMVGGDYFVPGETLWYKCITKGEWLPLPPRYTVVMEEDDE